jgi:hypothetical protein
VDDFAHKVKTTRATDIVTMSGLALCVEDPWLSGSITM